MGRIVAGFAVALLSLPALAGVTDAQVQGYLQNKKRWAAG
jgi:hypothetical protein